MRLKVKESFFYTGDGILSSTDPGLLHITFDMLTGMFDQVDFKTNVHKIVGMVCHPCRLIRVRTDKAYTQRMTGAGRSYNEIQRERVNYPECRKYLARGSLDAHCQNQNGAKKGVRVKEVEGEGGGNDSRTCRMAFKTKAGPSHCPVEGCSGQEATWTATRVQFWHWHVWDTVVILEEGNLPHPWFPLCDMLVLWWSLNGSHNNTVQFKKGTEQKRRNLAADEARAVTSRAFNA